MTAMPLEEGVARLTHIATRRLNTGQGTQAVLAWLDSASTGQMFGSTAAAVVTRLIRGAS